MTLVSREPWKLLLTGPINPDRHLAKRGLWSSAFNYAKLLLSLDPHDDPHGALLWLDFLSIKSNNLDWIVEAEEVYLSAFLPGLVYNKALAAKMRLPKGSTVSFYDDTPAATDIA